MAKASHRGVISPVLWNSAFDELLRALAVETALLKVAFADDLMLLANGTDLVAMRDTLQRALRIASAWGEENGLKWGCSSGLV